MKKVKTVWGRMLSYTHRSQPASISGEGCTNQKETHLSNTQSLLPRIVKELPSPKLLSKQNIRKLSQNGDQRPCLWLSVKANRSKESRVDVLAPPRMASPGSFYEMQTLQPHLRFRKLLG